MQGELCWVNVVVNNISRGCREVVDYPPAAIILGNPPRPEQRRLGRGVWGTDQPFDQPYTPSPGTH